MTRKCDISDDERRNRLRYAPVTAQICLQEEGCGFRREVSSLKPLAQSDGDRCRRDPAGNLTTKLNVSSAQPPWARTPTGTLTDAPAQGAPQMPAHTPMCGLPPCPPTTTDAALTARRCTDGRRANGPWRLTEKATGWPSGGHKQLLRHRHRDQLHGRSRTDTAWL